MVEVALKNVRLSFPDLFEAKPFKPGDKPKFGASFLIPKDSPQVAVIEQAIKEAVGEKFGAAKADAIIKSARGNPNKFFFQDGDSKDYDGYAGMMSASAKNLVRPLIIDRDKTPLSAEDGRPYAGCYVNAKIDIYAYDNGGKGVTASLKGVQFVKDGDAFAGGTPADPDDFEDLGMDEDEEDMSDVA